MNHRLTPHFLYSLLLSFSLLSVSGCGGEKGQKDGQKDTENRLPGNADGAEVQNPELIDSPPPSNAAEPEGELPAEEVYDYAYFDAVVVGNGVRSRSEPSTSGKVERKFDFGELIRLDGKSEKRKVLMKKDQCDYYGWHWHQAVDNNDNKSWVFGKFIMEIALDIRHTKDAYENARIWGQKISFEGKKYVFGGAYDFSFGTSDEEGLTGCTGLMMPFLFTPNRDKIQPIYLDENKFNSEDLAWKNDRYDTQVLVLVAASDG
ncbi:MAG: hypothetical protein AAF570_17305, partial [Bacteroidota bacterium]